MFCKWLFGTETFSGISKNAHQMTKFVTFFEKILILPSMDRLCCAQDEKTDNGLWWCWGEGGGSTSILF